MPVYHRTQRLQIFGEKPEIEKLYGNRYRMVVRCVAANGTRAWYNANKSQIFADFGTLYDAQMSVDGIDARTGEAYPDMVLVENKAYIYGRSEEYLVEFTYETLTDSFVQETEDKVDFDLNGLKRLTRTIIAKDTVAYSSVVGTTTIVGSSPLLTLAQVSEDQLEASQDGFKRIQELWLESGQLSLSEESGPSGIPNTKVRKYTSQITEPTSSGIILSRNTDNTSGYKIYTYSFLEGSVLGSSPVTVTGEIISYEQNLEVRTAGVISGNLTSVYDGTGTGTLAYLSVVPPSIKIVNATVSIKLVTTSTVGTPVAYNLSDTSCGAIVTTSKKSPIGIEQGSVLKVVVYNHSHSQQARSFPNSYASGSDVSGSVVTPAQIIRDDDNIIGESTKETVTTVVDIFGSTTPPATSGLYQEDIEPAFLDADGVQYFRKTSYTI